MNKNLASAKAKFVTWKICWQRLSTLDRLAKWSVIQSAQCQVSSKSGNSPTSIPRLPYNQRIRSLTMKVFSTYAISSTLNQEITRLSKIASKKIITVKVYVALWTELMYAIWITRCNYVYQNRPISPKYVSRTIVFSTLLLVLMIIIKLFF